MVLAPVLIDLGVLLTALVGLALCLLAAKFIGGMLNGIASLIGHIPLIGNVTSGAIHRIEAKVTNAIGGVVESLQARIGQLWHSTARLVEEIGAKIEDAYALIHAVVGHLSIAAPWQPILDLIHALQAVVARLHGVTKAQTQAIARAGRAADDARRRADTATARAQAVPADVVLPGDLSGLRGRVREAEDEIGRLWDRVRGLAVPSVAAVGVAAIASVLARLGLGWARCSNVGKVGRNVCGMDNSLLEALLADSLLVLGTVSLVEFAHEMVGVTELAVRPITDFWRAS